MIMKDSVSSNGDAKAQQTSQMPQGSERTGQQKSSGSARMSGSEQLAAINALLRGDADDAGDALHDEAEENGSEAARDAQRPAADSDGEAAGGPEPSEGGQDPTEGQDGAETDQPEALTLHGIAEKLEIPVEALYEMAIPIGGDGEVSTFAALKDAYKDRQATEREAALQEVALQKREAALTSDIQALGVLDAMQVLPDHVREQANAHMHQFAEREYGKFLDLVPELQDDATRIAHHKDVDSLLAEYGLIPEQFGAATLGMHRLIRDVLGMRRSLAKLTEPKAQTPPKPVKRNRKAAPRQSEGPKPKGRAAEIAAIAQLLGDT